MTTWVWLGLAAALTLVTANALTTRRLWSSDSYEPPQKIAQTVILWLLPGSVLAIRHFLLEPHGTPIRDQAVEVGPLDAREFEPPDRHGGGGGHDGL
jgi:hypothetical protein